MEFVALDAGQFMADGGALFGVVPKALWEKRYKCDENNMCLLSLRCLLVKVDDRVILIETGVGNKLDEKYLNNNGTSSFPNIFTALDEKGISANEITDVVLTHLHWDHVGGATRIDDETGKVVPSFPNAKYWVSKTQWDHAHNANYREKSVYFPDNYYPLLDEGLLEFIESDSFIHPKIQLRHFNGHTPGQLIPFIETSAGTVIYSSDMIPTAMHMPIPWVAAYDSYPVTVYEEKEKLLKEIAGKDYFLFFEHDYYTEMASVKWDRKHPEVNEQLTLVDFQNRMR
ncbi:MBL fold metallo-hydrolase [Prolixibacteraceae bacterium JC049]|nr:MBL fold metallo-hydrolase [Prolixibacteraceae bacterium JC049]